MDTIAYFISSHGFGHAARACAVMEAIHQQKPDIHFYIFTKVPSWFFQNSLGNYYEYIDCLTDIGLIQHNPLHEDISSSIEALNRFYPLNQDLVTQLADQVKNYQCKLLICDISPIGIDVANQANIPSILIENFTWDWIYEPYKRIDNRINVYIDYLHDVFTQATYRIQTEPVCNPQSSELTTPPVSRAIKKKSLQIRNELHIHSSQQLILITMGGISSQNILIDHLKQYPHVEFIVPGASKQFKREENVICLPNDSCFFHPDLVGACDAVIGKVGYSTLAEVYYAGIPFGYIARPIFRESKPLVQYIQTHMSGISIDEHLFYSHDWSTFLEPLIHLPKYQHTHSNGSEYIAQWIMEEWLS
ncbi:MAG: hypothetical protein HQK77_04915 [Desulfobacterales bacterium]|nr:hypothetical protein [Desulfobacterales bacterium]